MTSRATRPRVTPPLTKQLAPPVSCLLNPPTQPGGSRKEIEVVLGLRRYDCDRKRFQSKPGRGPAVLHLLVLDGQPSAVTLYLSAWKAQPTAWKAKQPTFNG